MPCEEEQIPPSEYRWLFRWAIQAFEEIIHPKKKSFG